MATKNYTVEIINWVWATAKSSNNDYYFQDHKLPCIKNFKTQKAARTWLASQCFTPMFKSKKPSMYKSIGGGLQATIKEAGKDDWLPSSCEARMQKRAIKAAF